jgi:hypothetical protein
VKLVDSSVARKGSKSSGQIVKIGLEGETQRVVKTDAFQISKMTKTV